MIGWPRLLKLIASRDVVGWKRFPKLKSPLTDQDSLRQFWKTREVQFTILSVTFWDNSEFEFFLPFYLTFDLKYPSNLSTFQWLWARALFWCIKCLRLIKFNIWPFFIYVAIFDFLCPRLTSRLSFLKRLAQELSFEVQFLYYWKRLKLDVFSVFVTSHDLRWPPDYFVWKADVKTVILIYNLPHFIVVQNLPIFGILDLGWKKNSKIFCWKVLKKTFFPGDKE